MSKDIKVDLTLLKRLSSELETLLKTATHIKGLAVPTSEHYQENVAEFIVELSKAFGMASGIAQEASALSIEIMHEVRDIQGPNKPKDSSMESLFGFLPPEEDYGADDKKKN